MIHIQKKNKAKLLLILTAVMAVLVAGYFVLVSLLPDNSGGTPPPAYEKLPWEGSSQRVFPDVDSSDLQYITVNATDGSKYASYGLIKSDDGTFKLWYQTEKGVEDYREFSPDIVSADPAFTYSSLYAMDSFGQGQVARFFYLRSAVTTMYFTERISLEGLSEDALRSYLEEFGFMDYGDYSDPEDDEELGVRVNYGDGSLDESGNNVDTHVIWVGGKNVSENGYYVILDDHPYIYATNNSTIGYATQPYTYYINPAVISGSAATNAVQAPYLIKDYQQWKNELISTPGTEIPENVEVIVKGETFLPADPEKGGLISQEESTSFDLAALKKTGSAPYQRLIRLLRMRTLTGILNAGTDSETMPSLSTSFYITVAAEALSVSYASGESTATYTYKIAKILSALTEDGEITEIGAAIPADATALRVVYDVYKNGSSKKSNEEPIHSVLSLSDDRIADKKAEIMAQPIGDVNIELQITYDSAAMSKNHQRKVEVFVADIVSIYNDKGQAMQTITEDSIVVYRYYLEVNDQSKDEKTYYTAADKVADMDDENKALFLSIGKTGTGYDVKIGEYAEDLQVMQDFIAYRVDAIPYMIKRTEIVRFNFINYSQRDPFYGESIYENKTENKDIYGLNDDSCQSVLLHLGGVGESTSVAYGYSGEETVAIGLTPENMRKYGLYANTVYYLLPRGVKEISGSGEDSETMGDYDSETQLGFTVYISDKKADGSRYIASDLYGVVVRVTDEKLDYLDLSFLDFWARRLLASTDIDKIEQLEVEFNFDDKKGRFDFILEHHDVPNPNNNTVVDMIRIKVCPYENAYSNALVDYIIAGGKVPGELLADGTLVALSLVTLYNRLGPEELIREGVSVMGEDYAGTYFFKQTLGILYTTMYLETLSEQEQTEILENNTMLARISFVLAETEYKYTYEFYRASDRRVLVKLYRADAAGNPVRNVTPVSDFAISTPVFKKFMGAFDAILNARIVTGDESFFEPITPAD